LIGLELANMAAQDSGFTGGNWDAQLLAKSFDDGADEQRTEQTLCHGTQSVNAIAAGRKDDVFSLEESFHRGGSFYVGWVDRFVNCSLQYHRSCRGGS